MIEAIGYLLIFVFLWGLVGLLTVLSTFLSKSGREHYRRESLRNPRFLCDSLLGGVMLGFLAIFFLIYYKIKDLMSYFDYTKKDNL